MTNELRTTALLTLVVAMSVACAGGPRAAGPATHSPTCIVTDGTAVTELRILLLHDVRPENAPVPRNASESFIFGQLYEPLIRTDCEGRAVSALAASWSADAAGRSWQFILRAATFDDGVPVTPASVVDAWTARGLIADDVAAGNVDTGGVGIVRAAAVGSELHVELTTGVSPSWFGRPELTVNRAAAGWPVGTGAYRARTDAARGTLLLEAREPDPRRPGAIAVRLLRDNDPRAPLDAGTDLVSAYDPTVLEYARALGGYVSVPAGWTRTYVLASRQAASLAPARDADAFAAGVARDLPLPAGTRVAAPLPAWSTAGCRASESLTGVPAAAGPGRTPVVAYPRGDEIARSIAERIAALAWPAARSPAWLTAVLGDTPASDPLLVEPLHEAALADALRAGTLFAAVLPVPRTTGVDCAGMSLSAAPAAAALLRSNWLVTPVLDAALRVLYSRAPGRLLLDADGVLRFDGGSP